MKIKILAAAAAFPFLAILPAQAMMISEMNHEVSLGAGIANPATSQSIGGENPAGLIYNFGTEFDAFAHSENSSFDPYTFGGNLLTGNGATGAGISLTHDRGADRTLVGFGLAADLRSLDVAIGFAGHYRASGLKVGNDFTGDAGAVFNPMGQFRLGVTAYDVTNSVSALGGGIAMDVSRGAVFAVDATSDKKLKGLSIKPALSVSSDRVSLSYGYGIQVDKDYPVQVMRLKSSVGLNFAFTRNVSLEAYYNQVDEYYVGLNFKL